MKNTLLWILALIIMLSAAYYQRTTGPTYPYSGLFEVNGETYDYKLPRSQETTEKARITLPNPAASKFAAQLHYKRYKTDDTLTVAQFAKGENESAAYLPIQPAAGKMEYYITLSVDGSTLRIPEKEEENILLRYKDPVPTGVLLPHVIMMFFSMLFGIYTFLSAIFKLDNTRKWALITLIGMTIGGMILGPFVQKFAFGEYWTGWPYGYDLTDNKTLIMWLVWVVAVFVLNSKFITKEIFRRSVVIAAAFVMTVVYLIPHSMRGSELNYDKIDQGVDSKEAIGTGD